MTNIPEHYEKYECDDCETVISTAPRAEETDVGVFCHDCGKTLAGGLNE